MQSRETKAVAAKVTAEGEIESPFERFNSSVKHCLT